MDLSMQTQMTPSQIRDLPDEDFMSYLAYHRTYGLPIFRQINQNAIYINAYIQANSDSKKRRKVEFEKYLCWEDHDKIMNHRKLAAPKIDEMQKLEKIFNLKSVEKKIISKETQKAVLDELAKKRSVLDVARKFKISTDAVKKIRQGNEDK